MLIGETGTPNLMLLLSGLLLIGAGVAAIYFRQGVAEYLFDLRIQILGEPAGYDARKRERSNDPVGQPLIPVVAGAILIVLGLIGAYGGLFTEVTPRS